VDHRLRMMAAPGDRARAVALLESMGYTVGERDPLALLTPGRSRVSLDVDDEPSSVGRTLFVDGTQVHVPGPESWLLRILAPSGPRPQVLTLERACDVVSLIQDVAFDWERLFSLAAERRRELRVRAGISAACRLLRCGVPHEVVARSTGARDERASTFLQLSAVSTAAPRARLLANRLKSVAPTEQGSVGRFSPTPEPVIDRMLSCANVSAADVVLDLGCGDWRVAIRAAERFGAQGIGVDRDRALVAEARARAQAAGQESRTRFIEGDLFDADLTQATVVCLYLQTFAYRRLGEWLRANATVGTRIVSHDVGFPDWLPTAAELVVNDLRTSVVYCWVIPPRSASSPGRQACE